MRELSRTLPSIALPAVDPAEGNAKLPKRERTRRQLLRAAMAVFSARGVEAASVQEIAAAAGVANGTFYNYFPTKEAALEAVAMWIADSLCRRISASYEHIADGAERMAIGNRRYVLLAAESPDWARLVLDVAAAAPALLAHINRYVRADLALGVRQGRFRVPNAKAALDLIDGTVTQAMRTVAAGRAGRGHAVLTATVVLRGLGMPFDEAAAVARRALPALPAALARSRGA